MDDEFSNWNWTQPSKIQEEMWNWAIHYLDLGWNIMPIEAAGKKPRLYKWEHLIQEKATPAMIDEWWDQWPHANIGLICGKISDIVCLDIDDTSKCDWAISSGKLPMTAQSKTARGYHYFFKYPKRGCISFKGDGFDLQSDGKYVILPPSEHSSGKFYEWRIDPFHEIDAFADLPDWLLDKMPTPGPTGDAIIKPLFTMENFFQPVGEGERNNAAARLAGHLFKQDREFDEVLCTVLGWNMRNSPPLHPREVRTVVESVFKKHQRRS